MKNKIFKILVAVMFIFAMIGPNLSEQSITAVAAAKLFIL